MADTDNRVKYGGRVPISGPERHGAGGGMLLLCAVCALCLAVLAMLSMSSARAHKAASDACLAETAGYYAACLEADQELAAWRAAGNTGIFERSFRISEAQDLHVRAVAYMDGHLGIETWAPVPSGGWETEEIIEVIH